MEGTETKTKPFGSARSPPSKSCGYGHRADGKTANNEGPEKETLLVSGDVKSPKNEVIWDSKQGCTDCQVNHVKVYRPTPRLCMS